jgi:hypothetical protein
VFVLLQEAQEEQVGQVEPGVLEVLVVLVEV